MHDGLTPGQRNADREVFEKMKNELEVARRAAHHARKTYAENAPPADYLHSRESKALQIDFASLASLDAEAKGLLQEKNANAVRGAILRATERYLAFKRIYEERLERL